MIMRPSIEPEQMIYLNYKEVLTKHASSITKFLQNGINTLRIGKKQNGNSIYTSTKRCLRDDLRDSYEDDEYWYQLWTDSRLEDEYSDHLGI